MQAELIMDVEQIKARIGKWDDEQVETLSQAVESLSMYREFKHRLEKVEPGLLELLCRMDDQTLDKLDDTLDDEVLRRVRNKAKLQQAHVLEQGEAAMADHRRMDRMKMIAYRAARIMKLAELNSPDAILWHSIFSLTKDPGYAAWAVGWEETRKQMMEQE